MAYHWRDGFEFTREPNGDVTLTVPARPYDANLTIPYLEWISIIASMCIEGETAVTYRVAEKFHGISK